MREKENDISVSSHDDLSVFERPKSALAESFRAIRSSLQFLYKKQIPEGARILVTFLPDDESEFWIQTSRGSLDAIWDNTEDDVYAQLLQK